MKPNLAQMLAARAEVDEFLNKALVMIAPWPETELTPAEVEVARGSVNAYIRLAENALERFQEAARGS